MLCNKCGQDLPEDSFYKYSPSSGRTGVRPGCKECTRNTNNENYGQAHANTDSRRAIARRSHLKHKYGITPDDYTRLFLAQQGACAICGGSTIHATMKDSTLCVDHDHATGLVRGLLCHPCNVLLGKAQDSIGILQKAIVYLERTQTLTGGITL